MYVISGLAEPIVKVSMCLQPATTAALAPTNNDSNKIIVILVSPVPAECVRVIVVREKHVHFSLRVPASGFLG